ncbi:MAG: tRNA glutamyl-Q(34) synthetase GluQRS [Planctomycetota bacterium]|nr:tRNA glutamyl-Q(34) synthetase GluQRS [Planctomycetota bacterium]
MTDRCESRGVVVGRLAPSPTGALHLGNARTFLLGWLSVRARGGLLTCRIEDLDGPRIKQGAADQALEDLAWLGLDWDGEVTCQSARLSRYQAALDHLVQRELAYPCVCTRSEIERAQSAPQDVLDHGTRYPGTCDGKFDSAEAAKSATGRDPAWRFRVQPGEIVFDDSLHGSLHIDVAADAGDFVVAKKDGQPAYQLAVVIDDADFEVTEVLRGDDLLSSTPRQILLYRALGLQAPAWAHVPLIVGPDGRRLAKRHGDTRLASLRDEGVDPQAIVGYLAWTAGLLDAPRALPVAALLDGFDLSRVVTEQTVFDSDEFLRMM